MLILLDCRPLQSAGPDSEKSRLIVSAVAGLSGDKAVEWLFLVDHTYRPGQLPGLPGVLSDRSGVRPDQDGLLTDLPGSRLLTARGLPGPLGWKLWYDWQLPRLVKRYQPDLVMLTGGVTAKLAGTRQFVWMPVFANHKETAAGATASAGAVVPIYAARLGTSMRHADTIFCFSEKDRTWLAGRQHIDAGKILVVRPSPWADIHPLGVSDKEAIKQRYTGGKEYFFAGVAGAGEEDVVQLLKAFSLFKRRQLSNLQLVMAGVRTEALRHRLETYKYRGDVHWAGSNTQDLLPAAYAVLFPFEDGSLGSSLMNAWKARVPALVARSSRLREMADDDALVAGVDDPTALASYMMAVYKDETLRNALIEKGTSRLTVFDPASSFDAIRTAIHREINKIK
jgi:glycosyltransferase involved in cell wall biosynthesis